MGVTNHVSSDSQGEQRAPMTLDPSGKSTCKLPDAYLIEDLIKLIQSDVSAPKISENEIRPYLNVLCAKQKDKAWTPHVSGSLKKGKLADDDIQP